VSAVLDSVTVGAAIGSATTAGVFLSFSALVMPALARLPAHEGIAAMQSINRTAVRPVFMTVLFGTAAACVPLVVAGVRSWGTPPAALLTAGSALFLAGTIGLTVVRNVPLNDALAGVDPRAPGAGQHWNGYLRRWRSANNLRTGAALAAAAALSLASAP
jgi:uncharacterized membrane protein